MIKLDHYTKQLRSLLENQRFAVLSTRQSDGQPYANLIAFCVSIDLRQLIFCTLRSTRKFANIMSDNRLALLIDNRTNEEADLQEAMAVTVIGACEEARDEERVSLSKKYLARHPTTEEFVGSSECAVMKVDVQSYYLVAHFQNVIELHVHELEHHD